MREKKLFHISIGVVSIFLFSFFSFLFSQSVFAHVIVYPKEVGVAKVQEFTMIAPSEKDVPTVGLKLLIPKGVQDVVPNVKAGWSVNMVKNGDTVTEIDWADGVIPPGERDDFLFQAQVPATTTTIKWKAYQTYADGSTVSWDHSPSSNPEDDSAPPPYSTTTIINDLQVTPVVTQNQEEHTSKKADIALLLSILAMLGAGVAVTLQKRK